MKTGTDMMAGQSPLFRYSPPRRRRWPYRYRWLLIGAVILAVQGLVLLAAARVGPW